MQNASLKDLCFYPCYILASVNGQSEDCNPCLETECPRFLNADCTAVLCKAVFTWRGSNVTDRCAVTTCQTKRCDSNRDCVEMVNLPTCPEDNPKCRQYILSRCVLQSPSHPCNVMWRHRVWGGNDVPKKGQTSWFQTSTEVCADKFLGTSLIKQL